MKDVRFQLIDEDVLESVKRIRESLNDMVNAFAVDALDTTSNLSRAFSSFSHIAEASEDDDRYVITSIHDSLVDTRNLN